MRGFPIWALMLLGVARLGCAQIFDEATLKERAAGARNADAEATVVVYNETDRESRDLAVIYAGKRNIARDHLVGLQCPTAEEITRAEYDTTIAEPLRRAFQKKGWWTLSLAGPEQQVEKTSIHFVALMRGIPLKIKPQFEPYAGDRPYGVPPISTHNEAAVDSELAVLGACTYQISGALENPYYRGFIPIAGANIPWMLLVCRLDGPTSDTVQRVINDSLLAEQEGLRGFAYIDARNTTIDGLKVGDNWLYNAAITARKKGLPTILDNGEGLFPVMYPMRRAAVYFGWYSQDVAGPFQRPDFRFQRGAVAVHIHSFSALTLRDPKRFWCAPLLEAGAAATLGNVYEPYLGLTPAVDTFYDRLRAGFSFAESAYMSQRFLSWMTTFVGDPLYRPFKRDNDLSARKPNDEWTAYAEGARVWFSEGPTAGRAALESSAKKFKSGMIMEGLGLLQIAGGDSNASIDSFAQAAKLYTNPEDSTRASIHAVLQLKGLNHIGEATTLARKQIAAFPKTPAVELLKAIESEMALPPPKTVDTAK